MEAGIVWEENQVRQRGVPGLEKEDDWRKDAVRHAARRSRKLSGQQGAIQARRREASPGNHEEVIGRRKERGKQRTGTRQEQNGRSNTWQARAFMSSLFYYIRIIPLSPACCIGLSISSPFSTWCPKQTLLVQTPIQSRSLIEQLAIDPLKLTKKTRESWQLSSPITSSKLRILSACPLRSRVCKRVK